MKPVTGGAALLLLLAFLMLMSYMSRESCVAGAPAFALPPGAVLVQFGSGFPQAESVRQISDDASIAGVIELAGLPLTAVCAGEARSQAAVKSGQRLDLQVQDGVVEGFFLGWMPAAQRVALGIPLHPDQMNCDDWQYLPGIGPRIAQRIVVNRQKFGDFGTLEGVTRVQGIGNRNISAWRHFFIRL